MDLAEDPGRTPSGELREAPDADPASACEDPSMGPQAGRPRCPRRRTRRSSCLTRWSETAGGADVDWSCENIHDGDRAQAYAGGHPSGVTIGADGAKVVDVRSAEKVTCFAVEEVVGAMERERIETDGSNTQVVWIGLKVTRRRSEADE